MLYLFNIIFTRNKGILYYKIDKLLIKVLKLKI